MLFLEIAQCNENNFWAYLPHKKILQYKFDVHSLISYMTKPNFSEIKWKNAREMFTHLHFKRYLDTNDEIYGIKNLDENI